MKTLDKTQKVTKVGGRAPLRYLQGGYGFDAAGKCLGKFTDSGEAMESEPKAPTTPHPDPAAGPSQDEAVSFLAGLKVPELKALAKEAGIADADTMKKAELIEALTPAENDDDDQDEAGA